MSEKEKDTVIQMEREINRLRKEVSDRDIQIEHMEYERQKYIEMHQTAENLLSACLWLALKRLRKKLIVSAGEIAEAERRIREQTAFIMQGENISGDYLLSAGAVASFEEADLIEE